MLWELELDFIITALLMMHGVKLIVKSSLRNSCLILFRLVTVLENYNSNVTILRDLNFCFHISCLLLPY